MKTALIAALRLLVGVVLFVGLSLLGWGLRDIQGFFSHPARLTYVVLMVLLSSMVVFFFPEVGQNRGPGKKLVRRQGIAVVLIQILSIGMVLTGPYCDRREIGILNFELVRYFGLVLLCLGFVVMILATVLLGRMFSVQVTIQEGHKLITHGLYRHLRHPRYLGIVVFMVGIALVFRSWAALLFVLGVVVVLLWRIQDEEALLHQEFGASWEAYVKRSWRLVPFLY